MPGVIPQRQACSLARPSWPRVTPSTDGAAIATSATTTPARRTQRPSVRRRSARVTATLYRTRQGRATRAASQNTTRKAGKVSAGGSFEAATSTGIAGIGDGIGEELRVGTLIPTLLGGVSMSQTIPADSPGPHEPGDPHVGRRVGLAEEGRDGAEAVAVLGALLRLHRLERGGQRADEDGPGDLARHDDGRDPDGRGQRDRADHREHDGAGVAARRRGVDREVDAVAGIELERRRVADPIAGDAVPGGDGDLPVARRGAATHPLSLGVEALEVDGLR